MRKLRTIELQRISVDDFKKAQKIPLTVVLDDVRSLHNDMVCLRFRIVGQGIGFDTFDHCQQAVAACG